MDTASDYNKILKKIAKERLSPYGIVQSGNSRTFLFDNRWYTVVVEFQPSSSATGSYLNIGVDFNFYPRDHFAFAYGYREKNFAEAKDDAYFIKIINDYCDFTIKKVDELKLKFKDVETAAATYQKKVDNDPWNNFEMGILYGLTGQINKSQKHLTKVKNEKCVHDFEFERQKLVTEILTWLDSKQNFILKMTDLINETRKLKKITSGAGLEDLKSGTSFSNVLAKAELMEYN